MSSAAAYWKAFLAGDRKAFAPLYRHYFGLLVAYCLGFLQEQSQAEDIAQEVLVRLHETPEKADIRNVNAWLYTAARNKCLNWIAVEKRRREILEENWSPEHLIDRGSLPDRHSQQHLDALLEVRLGEEDRTIWRMHSEGYDNAEIAGQLKLTTKTVANRKSRIRNELKQALRND